nr:MAG TPA: hypothetical protein [Caudoviricetes sp.]
MSILKSKNILLFDFFIVLYIKGVDFNDYRRKTKKNFF